MKMFGCGCVANENFEPVEFCKEGSKLYEKVNTAQSKLYAEKKYTLHWLYETEEARKWYAHFGQELP